MYMCVYVLYDHKSWGPIALAIASVCIYTYKYMYM